MREKSYSGTLRFASWTVLIASLAVLGAALGPTGGPRQEGTGRKSTEPPVRPYGKLGQDLFLAIDHRDIAGVQSLLKQGADPNSRNGLEFRPLYIAAASYQMDVMNALLAAGAKPDVLSAYGTPLTFAAISGNLAGANILISHGANVNTIRTDGLSVLMMAANAGNPALVEELLKHKMDVNVQDDGGFSALSLAARNGHVEVGGMLLAAGAKVDSPDVDGQTPLMIASMTGHPDFVQVLLKNGAKPNAKDGNGRTALILAASYGDYPVVVKALIAAGANPKAKDAKGRTASDLARAHGYGETATVLGATPSRSPAERTPRQAVSLSLNLLQSATRQFEEGATCVSCHQEGLGRIATGEARSHGFRLDPAVQRAQLERIKGMLTVLRPLNESALKNPEIMKQLPLIEINEVTTSDTWVLAGMAAHGQAPNEATSAMAMVLGRQQSPQGNWSFSLPRVPMQSSPFTFTALAVRSLGVYGPKSQAAEITERIGRAKDWLLHAPAKSSEDRASQLLGLKWAGTDARSRQGTVDAILADQQPDGGWSQMPNLHSDAYATGQALYALHVGGGLPVKDPVYKRGVRFLLRTQDDDGSWFVAKRALPANNYFDAGFPHGESQYSSFNGTSWATLALLQVSGSNEPPKSGY